MSNPTQDKPIFTPEPDSCWLVVVECRHNAIRIAPDGKGFFIPGQEACWGLEHVQEWIEQIWPREKLAHCLQCNLRKHTDEMAGYHIENRRGVCLKCFASYR